MIPILEFRQERRSYNVQGVKSKQKQSNVDKRGDLGMEGERQRPPRGLEDAADILFAELGDSYKGVHHCWVRFSLMFLKREKGTSGVSWSYFLIFLFQSHAHGHHIRCISYCGSQ